jgi:heat shock protein HslJ/uncharacterized membrane protein
MKNLLFVLLVLFVSSAYSQDDADFKSGIDFIGTGIEPLWSLKIDIEKGIYFNLLGENLKFETGIPKLTTVEDKGSVIFSGETPNFEIKIQINLNSCNDGKSDITYPYSVKVFINETGSDKAKELSGCGNYTFDNHLNDIWSLAKFKDIDVKNEKGLSSKPYIEIKINEHRIGGNASCNEFYGKAEIRGDKIVVDKYITLTKMNCNEMKFEIDFINAISGKTLYYRIDGLKLYLLENDNVIMEFNKMD